MPLRVPDQTHWPLRLPGLRWARQHSGALNGNCRRRPGRSWTPGPRAVRLAARPRLDSSRRRHIPSERKENLESPPQRHVHKKLVSPDRDNRLQLDRDNRLQLEWIALGCTAELFLDRAAALDRRAGKPGEVRASNLA